MAGAITPSVLYVLRKMVDEDEELVCEGNQCWVGEHRTTRGVERKLLRILAIKDVSDVKGLTRYVVNEFGRAILRRCLRFLWISIMDGPPRWALRGYLSHAF